MAKGTNQHKEKKKQKAAKVKKPIVSSVTSL
jgi:hypothetical protein